MRPNLARADADSHLWPCPQCGSANGLNAHACWNCDAALPPPDDALAPMPITAALEAQGVPMAEFEGNVPHALSMASIERPPAPSSKRRTLFEAAVARMNGEPDDPSDAWGDVSSEAFSNSQIDEAVVDIGLGPSEPGATEGPVPSMLDQPVGPAHDIATAIPAVCDGATDDGALEDGVPRDSATGDRPPGLRTGDDPLGGDQAIEDQATADTANGARATDVSSGTDPLSAELAMPEQSAVDDVKPDATEEMPSFEAAGVGGVHAGERRADAPDDAVEPREIAPTDLQGTDRSNDPSASAAAATQEAGFKQPADAPVPQPDVLPAAAPIDGAAPADRPAFPSFADEPFDESRFAVKSFDAWPSDDGSAEPEARAGRVASNEGSFPTSADDTAESAGAGPASSSSSIPPSPHTAEQKPVDEPGLFPWRAPSRPAMEPPHHPPADLGAILKPIDEPSPPRWQPSGGTFPHAEFLMADPAGGDPAPASGGAATESRPSEPPFIVASDPPFAAPPVDPHAAGRAPQRGEMPSDLPPAVLAELATPAASKDPAPVRRRSRPNRSPEAEAIQTFEDSFFAAGSHPSLHSDDDASFDSGRSGLGSTQPPIRGGRDVDAFGALPSARAGRNSDSFRDPALGEKFAALSSTSAQAAQRRRRVTIAALCLVGIAVVLAAYPFFGDGVRVNLSSDELRSAASTSTTPAAPAAPAPGTRVAEPVPSSTGSGVVTTSPPIAAVPTPAPVAAPVPAPAPNVAPSDDRPAPTARASAGETRPARVPREVAERLARRQTPANRTQDNAAVAPTTEQTRSDTGRPRTESSGLPAGAERTSPVAEAPAEARANRRSGTDETAAEAGGSITCTERILALNLCGPRPRKE